MLSSKLLPFVHFLLICNFLTVEGERKLKIIFVVYVVLLKLQNSLH